MSSDNDTGIVAELIGGVIGLVLLYYIVKYVFFPAVYIFVKCFF
jgi:hypothetical protein